MSSQMESIQRTQRTQCYFCGEEMPASQLEIHVKHCGCVLEKCLEGCGLYVQRQYKNHHKNWCKKDPTQEPQWQDMSGELARLRKHVEQEAAQRALQQQELLQQVDTVNQKMAKTEELNLKLIDAVTGIRKLVNDEQCARLNDILEVKTNVSESAKVITQLKFTLNQARVDVEELRNEIQSNEQYEKMYDQFSEWKKKQDEIVTGIKITMSKDIQAEINKLHKDNVMRSKSVNDLLDLNEVIIDNQDSYTEQIFQLEEDVKGFKKFLAEENIMISGIWREQLDEVKHLKSKFEETGKAMSTLFDEQNKIKDRLERVESFSTDLNNSNTNNGKIKILERTMSEDLIKELLDDRKLFKEKLESLELQNKPEAERTFSTDTSLSVFDETIVKQQEEIAKRLEMLEKLTTEIQNNCNKRSSTSTNNEQSETPVVINELSSEQAVIKRRLEMLEMITHELEEAKSNKKLLPTDSTVSINGRLMWTISNFDQKLDECKKTRTQIESPSFYTSENGYKLQLRAYLNGVGQWEGRHMIVSLNVLESQWDNRLVWPCRLKVVICLRDQEPIHRKAKDIVKSFTSSPASKGFSAPCLQMFIPHRTLYTRNYLKNNVVIIEVKTLPL